MGCNLKIKKLLNFGLIGVCVTISSYMIRLLEKKKKKSYSYQELYVVNS